MALVNHAKREINAKIVFCGPAAAGKSTLLKAIYSKLPVDSRGQLRTMGLQQDQMLFFDFTHPEGGDSESYRVRIHVYTLTGSVNQEHSWKMVLKGVDGIAFAADSDPARQDANRTMFFQLQAALNSYGKGLEDVPMAVLCTKRDLFTALSIEQITLGLSASSFSVVPVIATTGEGVMQSLALLLDGILKNLEGLGLALQPAVRMFRELSPVRSSLQSSSVVPQSVMEDKAPVSYGLEAGADSPMITFTGAAETGTDGVLRVPLTVSCCSKQVTLVLNISLQAKE